MARRSRLWPVVCLGAALWVGFLGFGIYDQSLPRTASGRMAVVFPPWWPGSRAIAAVGAADGRIVDAASVGFVWMVSGDGPALVGRLRAAGALAAFHPPGAIGCTLLGFSAPPDPDRGGRPADGAAAGPVP